MGLEELHCLTNNSYRFLWRGVGLENEELDRYGLRTVHRCAQFYEESHHLMTVLRGADFVVGATRVMSPHCRFTAFQLR